jgi:hypothetical protein
MQFRPSVIFSNRMGRAALSVVAAVTLGSGFYIFKHNYTPGPLTAAQTHGKELGGYHSHAEFERECLHCHAPVHCLSASRCQRCHLEIAAQRAEATGLHGILPGTDKCQHCHPEHRGRDAVISNVPFVNVDHRQLTGFDLARHGQDYEGEPMNCESCHPRGRFAAETVDCVTCHAAADPGFVGQHLAAFGAACADCHDGKDRMIGFEHRQVFALDGAHAEIECVDCHTGQIYSTASGECVTCHQEPPVHAGLFGFDCARCHSDVAWKPTQLTEHAFRLDHGGNGESACETCHVGTYVEHTCYGCHDHQPELVRAQHLGEGIDDVEGCVECHPTGQAGEAAQLVGRSPGAAGLGTEEIGDRSQ